jgi:amino acid adenylation domain-containing protein
MTVPERASRLRWLDLKAPALDLNGPAVPFRRFMEEWVEQPAIELFREAAEAHPEKIACQDQDSHLTYAQIWAACRRLAEMVETALAPGAPVGVLLPNEVRYPVAVLACLLARRPCVMIDRHHPGDRVAGIISEAQLAAVIVAEADVVGGLPLPAGIRTIAIDAAMQDGPVPEGGASDASLPEGADFVVYTSGSTGQPKGIVLSQRAVLHRAAELVNAVHLRPDDKVLSLASPSTIGGLQQIFEVMLSGATLVKLDLQRIGLGRVVAAVGERAITMMFSTPAVWRSVAGLETARASLASLRCIQSSGDVLLAVDLELIRSVLPASCLVLSVYGATEAPALIQWFVTSDKVGDESRVAAGYPLAGVAFAILDEAGAPVQAGEAGELVVKSPWMSRGLWISGSLHPGPFEKDPTDPSVPVYRTGDIVRLRRDGLFVTLGRKDRQVKVLGNRVELAEIETALKLMPEVADAAVIARHVGTEPRLHAFVVPRAPDTPDLLVRVRRRLSKVLPAYMRPSHLLAVEEMPLLPGRKVDEEALLARAARQSGPNSDLQSPAAASASQRSIDLVEKAWRRTFGQHPRGDDRFDESGGDSLRLLQLLFHLERLAGQTLTLDRFHGEMRPSEFALALEGPAARQDGVPTAGARRVFLIPGRGGDDPMLAAFRSSCSEALDFRTLSYPSLRQLAYGTFDDIVAHVAAEVEAGCPQGPILLAGYSFGGDVAYAVAERLRRRGRRIPALLILDTNAVDFGEDEGSRERRSLLRRFATLCRLVRTGEWRVIMGVLLTPAALGRPPARWGVRLATALAPRPTGNLAFHVGRHLREQLLEAHRAGWMSSRPARKLDVPVILFRSRQNSGDMGWNERTGDLAVVQVEGDHIGMLNRANVSALGKAFVRSVCGVPD